MATLMGWTAIILAIFSLAPSFVPGALSVIGLLLSLAALIISVFSVKTCGKVFFTTTLGIVAFGVLLVNDGLRLWDPLDLPNDLKLALYGLAVCVALICLFVAVARDRG